LTFCLSKGLACPVGSVVCGSGAFISEARRARKVLGGGLRQSGIIAAAGLVALDTMVPRLREDHAHARALAEGISRIPGLSVEVSLIRTNIVYFDLREDRDGADTLVQKCELHGVRFLRTGPVRFRMVTHYGIQREDIQRCLHVLEEVMRPLSRG
jgi:threonine aldolase